MAEKCYDTMHEKGQSALDLGEKIHVEGLKLCYTASTNNTISWMLLWDPRDVCVVGRESHLSKNGNEQFRLFYMLNQIIAAPAVGLDESVDTTVKFSNGTSHAQIATVREAKTKPDSTAQIGPFSVLQRRLFPLRPNILHLYQEE